jgi:hypothetical protein
VLVELAARVRAQVREVDTVARYGGEEFVVVLPETDAQGAALAAERIRSAVQRRPFGEPGDRRSTSPSASGRPSTRCTAAAPRRWWAGPTRRCTPPSAAAATPGGWPRSAATPERGRTGECPLPGIGSPHDLAAHRARRCDRRPAAGRSAAGAARPAYVITVAEHLGRVLSVVEPLSPLQLGLMDAHGCVLTEDVVAPAPLPAFDNSSMDGYAVRAADLAGATEASPVVLPVTGDVAAGPASPLRVQPGVCVRIMTGAMLPAGADAVVPVEWTDGGVASVVVRRVPDVGAHVRRAGEDVSR